MPELARLTAGRLLRLLVVAGAGFMLGACSKCDVPNFFPTSAPHACHSGPPAQ